MSEKKGFFDFLKNKNVKKLEKQGKDRYGRKTDSDSKYKAKAKKEFKGYADGGMARKAKKKHAKQNALMIIIGGGPKKK